MINNVRFIEHKLLSFIGQANVKINQIKHKFTFVLFCILQNILEAFCFNTFHKQIEAKMTREVKVIHYQTRISV